LRSIRKSTLSSNVYVLSWYKKKIVNKDLHYSKCICLYLVFNGVPCAIARIFLKKKEEYPNDSQRRGYAMDWITE
jgi:hypothetical protein